MIRRSALGFAGVVAAVFGLATTACGGDSSDPPESSSGGSTSGTGGATGSGGNDGMSGSGNTGSFECSYTAVPNENITDFAAWTGGDWQVDDMSLSGGSFTYNGDGTTVTATHDAAEENMHIEATVANYAGFGLWFGPCTDASAYEGIQFTISGAVGDSGSLDFQVQTSRNYPISTNDMKGECEGDFSSGCSFNTASAIEVTDTPETVQIPWADLTGGEPIATLDPTELLGIQWQFNCDSMAEEPCAVDVVIDDVSFY